MRKSVSAISEQQRCRSACTSAQSDQRLGCSLLATSRISRLLLVSVAKQTGLSLSWSETPQTGFLVTWLRVLKVYSIATEGIILSRKLMTKTLTRLACVFANSIKQVHSCRDSYLCRNVYTHWFYAGSGSHFICWWTCPFNEDIVTALLKK